MTDSHENFLYCENSFVPNPKEKDKNFVNILESFLEMNNKKRKYTEQ